MKFVFYWIWNTSCGFGGFVCFFGVGFLFVCFGFVLVVKRLLISIPGFKY